MNFYGNRNFSVSLGGQKTGISGELSALTHTPTAAVSPQLPDKSFLIARGMGRIYGRWSSCQAQEMPSLKADRRIHRGSRSLANAIGSPPAGCAPLGARSRVAEAPGSRAPARAPPERTPTPAAAESRTPARQSPARPARPSPPLVRLRPPGERGGRPLPSSTWCRGPRGRRARQPACAAAARPGPVGAGCAERPRPPAACVPSPPAGVAPARTCRIRGRRAPR